MGQSGALKIAIMWHMHQPNYQEPCSKTLAMPWVRLHALKDYLDMPLLAAEFPNVNVTFNLVPSLLDQIELYLDGGTDRYLELSKIPAEQATEAEKREIIECLFCGHPDRLIEPYPRYQELYHKFAPEINPQSEPITTAELRDLQVWSNLTWIDPMFRNEEPIKRLFEKGHGFTEDEKIAMLDWQLKLMARIIPTYRELYQNDRIDISFTPYYHPILPLLCDTNIARESMPGIELPPERFIHPEDAEYQISSAVAKFRELFGSELKGMWPSEGSVSEEVLHLIKKQGIQWVATDEEILSHSLALAQLDPITHPPHATYEYGPGLKLLFRDHALSDRVGFVYSGWNPEEAADDMIGQLLKLRDLYADNTDQHVVPVILDGENAWEYFANDGQDFLRAFYSKLDQHPDLESVFMRDAAAMPAKLLPNIFPGSWINHNFRIWIGHPEDNAAWELLTNARKRLVEFEAEQPTYAPDKLKLAWQQIYIAEGSDWCWWYGDEHRGKYNEEFDSLFRRHLAAVYELTGLDVPLKLLQPIHTGGERAAVVQPTSMLTAQVEGRLTHFYEWTGAGYFDCLKAGGAMHRVDRLVSAIQFAFDQDRLYIRLDFVNRKDIESIDKYKFRIGLYTPKPILLEFGETDSGFAGGEAGKFSYALDDILEVAIDRSFLWPDGFGRVAINVALIKEEQSVESWPEGEPIEIEVPELGAEMFWSA